MKKTLFLLLLLCPAGYSFAKRHSSASDVVTEASCIAMGKEALELTNQLRAKKGLSKLKWSQDVADIARKHSINMGKHKVEFGHDGFEKRVKEFALSSSSSAENVYMANYKNDVAKRAVDSWIDSSGHYKNLVGNFTHCGIGVYKNEEGYWYFTQIFAVFK